MYGHQLRGGLSARSNCTCIKAPVHAAVSSLFSLVICHQVHVLLKAAFACHSVLHAQVIIYNSGSNFSPSQHRVQDTLPSTPLLFSFKTKQKPKQGIQRMFFLPTKEISGASSKLLVSALGLAAMCSISHRLSPVTGKCAPTSWAAAGEQLGWAMLG